MASGDTLQFTPVSMHGIDVAGTFANRPKRGHHGALYYADDVDRMLFWDSKLQGWLPADGGYLHDSSEKYLADMFRYHTLDTDWDVASGSDPQALDPAIDIDAGEGLLLLTSGDAGTGAGADGSAIGHSLIWEAEEGTLVLAVRMEVSAITDIEFFVGFTDVLPATTLEMPFDFTDGTTIQSTATDACGMLFDTTATTDTIRLVGVAGDTDATAVDSSQAPTATTFHDYVVVVQTDGTMEAYFDGTSKGVVSSAVSVGVDLSPIVILNSTTTTSRTANVRRLLCHQDWDGN